MPSTFETDSDSQSQVSPPAGSNSSKHSTASKHSPAPSTILSPSVANEAPRVSNANNQNRASFNRGGGRAVIRRVGPGNGLDKIVRIVDGKPQQSPCNPQQFPPPNCRPPFFPPPPGCFPPPFMFPPGHPMSMRHPIPPLQKPEEIETPIPTNPVQETQPFFNNCNFYITDPSGNSMLPPFFSGGNRKNNPFMPPHQNNPSMPQPPPKATNPCCPPTQLTSPRMNEGLDSPCNGLNQRESRGREKVICHEVGCHAIGRSSTDSFHNNHHRRSRYRKSPPSTKSSERTEKFKFSNRCRNQTIRIESTDKPQNHQPPPQQQRRCSQRPPRINHCCQKCIDRYIEQKVCERLQAMKRAESCGCDPRGYNKPKQQQSAVPPTAVPYTPNTFITSSHITVKLPDSIRTLPPHQPSNHFQEPVICPTPVPCNPPEITNRITLNFPPEKSVASIHQPSSMLTTAKAVTPVKSRPVDVRSVSMPNVPGSQSEIAFVNASTSFSTLKHMPTTVQSNSRPASFIPPQHQDECVNVQPSCSKIRRIVISKTSNDDVRKRHITVYKQHVPHQNIDTCHRPTTHNNVQKHFPNSAPKNYNPVTRENLDCLGDRSFPTDVPLGHNVGLHLTNHGATLNIGGNPIELESTQSSQTTQTSETTSTSSSSSE